MTRQNSLFALVGCTLAFSSYSVISRADDGSVKPAAKSESSTTAAPTATTVNNSTSTAATFAWPTCDVPVKKSKEKGFPNFGKLNDFIFRSGAPSAEGLSRLKEMGIKTIVNLRKEDPSEKEHIPDGVKYVFIPIPDEHAPTAEQAQQFLDVASDPSNWPLLVHCHGGEGRAGVMSGLIRYEFDGWDRDKIMKEVDNFRSAHLGFIKVKMPSCQQDFIKDWLSSHKAGECAAKLGKPAEAAGSK